jgi:hypothetical protein
MTVKYCFITFAPDKIIPNNAVIYHQKFTLGKEGAMVKNLSTFLTLTPVAND